MEQLNDHLGRPASRYFYFFLYFCSPQQQESAPIPQPRPPLPEANTKPTVKNTSKTTANLHLPSKVPLCQPDGIWWRPRGMSEEAVCDMEQTRVLAQNPIQLKQQQTTGLVLKWGYVKYIQLTVRGKQTNTKDRTIDEKNKKLLPIKFFCRPWGSKDLGKIQ